MACVCRRSAAAAPASLWHARARVGGRAGAVLAPASGAFDVTVAPGASVQEGVDRCPPGGSLLLAPGVHLGPLILGDDKVSDISARGVREVRGVSVV